MKTLVIDLETVACFDEELAASLTKRCEDEEKRAAEIETFAALPVACQIVCAGTLHVEQDYVKSYCGPDEKATLHLLWHELSTANHVITFNGRGFDLPVALFRSAKYKIFPSRRDLWGYRYSAYPHCDLLDQLTSYGATRKFPLDAYCKTFGIASPKTDVSGADVDRLFKEGEYKKIEEYNAGDLRATAELFRRWQHFIEPLKR